MKNRKPSCKGSFETGKLRSEVFSQNNPQMAAISRNTTSLCVWLRTGAALALIHLLWWGGDLPHQTPRPISGHPLFTPRGEFWKPAASDHPPTAVAHGARALLETSQGHLFWRLFGSLDLGQKCLQEA